MKNGIVLQLKKLLPEGLPLFYYDEIDSTQSEARRAFSCDGSAERLHIAASQTAGRGRTGKTFYSPKDTGLYMTYTLQIPGKKTTDCIYLTTVAAVAVRRAILSVFGVQTEIKWVNDLYLGGKKVCGILVEALPEDGWFLVGVGVNLCTVDFPEELVGKAGALHDTGVSEMAGNDAEGLSSAEETTPGGLVGTPESLRNRLAAEVVRELKELSPVGMTPEIFEEYRAHSLLIGKRISFEQNGREYQGIATGLSVDCGLLVDVNGEQLELTSGMITEFER